MNLPDNGRCLIFLSGASPPFDIEEGDMKICADSGAEALWELGIEPDIVIGDMDSISGDILSEMKRRGVSVITHPVEKDISDGELALNEAISLSPDRIDILGGKRGRTDHLISSFQLLFRIPDTIQAVLHLEGDEVMLLREKSRAEIRTDKDVISVIPASTKAKVTVKGLKWDLDQKEMEMGSTLGIHNEPIDEVFSVEVKKGNVFLVLADRY